jgi:catechol 2,3-dioxygenase-like lactoylglutathione lyase family enzyme
VQDQKLNNQASAMKIDYLYAAVIVKDIEASEAFYTKVLGRQPDDRPMGTLVQWRGFSDAGIQLFEDPAKAGNGRMTIVVSDVGKTGLSLHEQGIDLGEVQQGDFGKIAQLSDPDGNLITFAEPPKKGAK